MALTRVSPALFQVSNNITSVTVGGSANTVSLTFDSNGVITGASNNALSVANTQITGTITAAQIAAVSNTAITGLIQAAQIGSANATLATSGTLPAARLPAGSVLQVVNATYSTVVNNGTASYVDTGLTATITPTKNTSKILVLVNQSGVNCGSVNNGVNIQLLRGASSIAIFAVAYSYAALAIGSASSCYLDSPATTSATTYKTQFARYAGAGNTQMQANSDVSTMTLMEIAA